MMTCSSREGHAKGVPRNLVSTFWDKIARGSAFGRVGACIMTWGNWGKHRRLWFVVCFVVGWALGMWLDPLRGF